MHLLYGRYEWKVSDWMHGPVSGEARVFVDFAFEPPADKSEIDKKNKIQEYKNLIEDPQTVFCYFYISNGSYVSNVDFYAINPVRRVIIMANHNM